MLVKILIVLAILIVAFVVVVALQPADFRVTRSTVIAASPGAIFLRVDAPRGFQEWNPFAKMDPNAKTTFAGPPAGVGSSLAWAGNPKMGEGRMTNIESRPHDLVRYKLEFIKPFQATNVAEFAFTRQGDQTVVTWSMTGRNNFVFKAFGLFINHDKMCGDAFEQGLSSLKALAEAAPAEVPRTYSVLTP